MHCLQCMWYPPYPFLATKSAKLPTPNITSVSYSFEISLISARNLPLQKSARSQIFSITVQWLRATKKSTMTFGPNQQYTCNAAVMATFFRQVYVFVVYYLILCSIPLELPNIP